MYLHFSLRPVSGSKESELDIAGIVFSFQNHLNEGLE